MLCLLPFDFCECQLLFISEYGQGAIKTLHQMDFSNMFIKAFWWQVNSCKLHFERLFVFVLSSGWMCLYEWQENYFKICLWGYCMFLKIPGQYLSSLLLLPNVIWQNKNQLKLIFPKLWHVWLHLKGINKHCWLFQPYLLAVIFWHWFPHDIFMYR